LFHIEEVMIKKKKKEMVMYKVNERVVLFY